MSDGMPKPTIAGAAGALRGRRRSIDDAVDAAVNAAPPPKQDREEQKQEAQKGMPKPGMFDRLKKLISR